MYEKNGIAVMGPKKKNDTSNICLLLFLYMLQGIPKALSRAMPLLFQNRNVDYIEQAVFSATALPFSCKLIWAPIIDCFYIPRLGQRKSWLVPSQFALGFCFLILGIFGNDWLGPENPSTTPKITQLSVTFAIMNMLAATQDVAVDGWALTMLQRENIGHAGTCDYVGRHIGELIGFILFTVLNSKDFCNTWLRNTPQPNGILSFSNFTLFWSIVFLISTTMILIFKSESSTHLNVDERTTRMTIGQSYKLLWRILKIKPLRTLCYIVLTSKIGFGVIEAVTPLKLIDLGVSSYKLVLIGIPLLPIQAILPFVIKRYLVGTKCLNCYVHAIIYRCFTSASIGIFVYFSLRMKVENHYPTYYYVIMFMLLGLEDMGHYAMVVPFAAFSARVSDANYGGTYITLLNTANYLSVKYPEMLALGLMQSLTVESCNVENISSTEIRMEHKLNYTTILNDFSSKRTELKINCTKILDGYFIEVILGIVFTILWLKFWAKKNIMNLQRLNEAAWYIRGTEKKNAVDSML